MDEDRDDRDTFRLSPTMDASVLETIADRLEFRGTDDGYARLSQAYFGSVPLHAAQWLPALGCGTGIEVRNPGHGRSGAVPVAGHPGAVSGSVSATQWWVSQREVLAALSAVPPKNLDALVARCVISSQNPSEPMPSPRLLMLKR